MVSPSWRRFVVKGLLGCWIIVSLAASLAMYSLWWQREKVNFLGVDPQDQRRVIWKQAGLPDGVLALLPRLETWPNDASYSIRGDTNRQSYLKYLLLPRVPRGSERYVVDVDSLQIQGEGSERILERELPLRGVFAPLGSLLIMAGITVLFRRITHRSGLSIPEALALSCLLVMLVVVASKAVLLQSFPAFILLSVISGGGWLWQLTRALKRHRMLKEEGSSAFPIKQVHADWRSVPLDRGELIFIVLLLSSLIWSVLMAVVVVPDDWDAWAIWGAKAKALALTVGPLQDVTYFGHGDYPLLWPAVWALSGWCGGGWEEMGSRIWGPVFMIMCCWELIHVVWCNSASRWASLFTAALFASIPMVPLVSSWSYAEAPFWLMTICTYGCLSRWRATGSTMDIACAALLTSAAAMTKNEGVLFSALVFLWVFASRRPGRYQAIGMLTAIFVCLYLPWVYWVKIHLALSSHATEGLRLNWGTLARAAERLPIALEVIGRMWADPRQWNVVLWGIAVTMLYALCQRQQREDFLLPLGMLLAYCIIVVFHTADIYWQVGTSWNRLTLQVIPLSLAIVVSRMVIPVRQWLI